MKGKKDHDYPSAMVKDGKDLEFSSYHCPRKGVEETINYYWENILEYSSLEERAGIWRLQQGLSESLKVYVKTKPCYRKILPYIF